MALLPKFFLKFSHHFSCSWRVEIVPQKVRPRGAFRNARFFKCTVCGQDRYVSTLNQMQVRRIFAHDNLHSVICPGTTLQESLHETVEFAILGS